MAGMIWVALLGLYIVAYVKLVNQQVALVPIEIKDRHLEQ